MRARTKHPATALVLLLLTSAFLTGCQSVNNAIDSVGGLFVSKKSAPCSGASCADDSLLDKSKTNHTWYCYGVTKGAEWDCQEKADPAKIIAIRDAAKPDANPAPLAPDMPTTVAPETEAALPAVLPADQPGMNSTDYLLQQPGDLFTVQLIAMQDEQELMQYARLNGIDTPLYTRMMTDGESWYVLLLGLYPDSSSAIMAKTEWHKARNLKAEPWIRQLAPLQDAIRQAQAEG
jgi:septal ring-binding cell division protein DamX